MSERWLAEALRERVKELECLAGVGRAVEHGTIEEILARVVELLPRGWRWPEHAVARIAFKDAVHQSGDFTSCTHIIGQDLSAAGAVIGRVEVGYPPEVENDPFLPEERNLLDMVAGRLGHAIERLQAEQALRESERRYRLLADNTLDVIWTLSLDLEFTYLNPAIERMLGYTPEEMLGRSLALFCSEETFAQAREVAQQQIALGPDAEGVFLELELASKQGAAVPVDIRARALFNGEGNPLGFQGTARDISERRLIEGQLRQAQKLEAVGRLAGGVAHDFNNMLAVILGNAHAALRQLAPGDPGHEELLEILEAGQRSAELTRQLLAFARRQTIVPRLVDLNEAVEGTLKLLRRLIGEDVAILWRPTPGLPLVRVDPGQVDQILTNLVVNARDALGGGGTIAIETGQVQVDESPARASGDHVFLSVSDSGPGIDDEVLSHIFEPFFSTKGETHGAGLGLATVHGIVTQNQGFVEVQTQLGLGTTFRVCLPAAGRPEAPPQAEREPRTVLAADGHTILVVEDEPALLRLVKRMLESLGYRVLAAEAPEQALTLFHRHAEEIDILLTDLVMPGMNGRELVARVAALRPDTRCLFMSGYTPDEVASRGVLAEDVPFLQKPFTREQLAQRLTELSRSPLPERGTLERDGGQDVVSPGGGRVGGRASGRSGRGPQSAPGGGSGLRL